MIKSSKTEGKTEGTFSELYPGHLHENISNLYITLYQKIYKKNIFWDLVRHTEDQEPCRWGT